MLISKFILMLLLVGYVVSSTAYGTYSDIPIGTNFVYSPMGGNLENGNTSEEKIRNDIKQLSTISKIIRIYDIGDMIPIVLDEAEKNSLKVSIGINLTFSDNKNYDLLQTFLEKIKPYERTVDSIILGDNESIWKNLTSDQLISYVKFIHENSNFRVTVMTNADIWIKNPILANTVDFLMFDAFTIYETDNPTHAVELIQTDYDMLAQKFPEKYLVLESGWSTTNSAIIDQRKFLIELDKKNMDYFVFEFQDESGKTSEIERGFGVDKQTYLMSSESEILRIEPSQPHRKNFLIQHLPIGNYEVIQLSSGKSTYFPHSDSQKLLLIDNEGVSSDVQIKKITESINIFRYIFALAEKPPNYMLVGGDSKNCNFNTNCIPIKFSKDNDPSIDAITIISTTITSVTVTVIIAIITYFYRKSESFMRNKRIVD